MRSPSILLELRDTETVCVQMKRLPNPDFRIIGRRAASLRSRRIRASPMVTEERRNGSITICSRSR